MRKAVAFVPVILLAAGGLAACDKGGSKPQTGVMTDDAGRKVEQAAQKTGQVVDDTAITAKVKMALLNAEDIKSGDISVDTTQGRVTLTGTVPEQPQVLRASTVAGDVEGVRDVNNKLTVKAAS